MLETNNLQRTTGGSPSTLAQTTPFSCLQNESLSAQSETACTYKKLTFALLIDEYTSETIVSSLIFQVFDQQGIDLTSDIEEEEYTNDHERNANCSTMQLYERVVSVQYKLESTEHCERIEDFFVCVRLSAANITKTSLFATCLVHENDYRHNPLLLHLEMSCANAPQLIIGIFRARLDDITDASHGDWIYKNASCLLKAFESSIEESSESDKETLDTATEDYCVSPEDTLDDAYTTVREKLVQVRKRIVGKSKRTVFYTISKEDLIDFFLLPRDEVAHELGICVTLLKKICRKNGIKQWPYRKLKNVDARLCSLRRLLSSPDSICKNRKKFHEEYCTLLQERERILRGNE